MAHAQVSWGAHELVLAARNLLRAALQEPLNQKFLMLSESGIPLYPPTTTYLQLLSEEKSRLDSCGIGVCSEGLSLREHPFLSTVEYKMNSHMSSCLICKSPHPRVREPDAPALQRTDPWRYTARMGYKLRQHWRKSSQWFALTRKHAELVMADTEILDIFQKYCQNAWDNSLNRYGLRTDMSCFISRKVPADQDFTDTRVSFLFESLQHYPAQTVSAGCCYDPSWDINVAGTPCSHWLRRSTCWLGDVQVLLCASQVARLLLGRALHAQPDRIPTARP
jgi:hypothetical protein